MQLFLSRLFNFELRPSEMWLTFFLKLSSAFFFIKVNVVNMSFAVKIWLNNNGWCVWSSVKNFSGIRWPIESNLFYFKLAGFSMNTTSWYHTFFRNTSPEMDHMLNDRYFGGFGGWVLKPKPGVGFIFSLYFHLVLVINRHTSLVPQVAVYANFVLPS